MRARSLATIIAGMLAGFAIGFLLILVLAAKAEARSYRHHGHQDARPRQWCGWWLRQHLGVADRRLNLARNWIGYGRPASGPCPGCIGVQRHHVFKVITVAGPGHVLAVSGNDGRAVRTRVRSTRNVIAWRMP